MMEIPPSLPSHLPPPLPPRTELDQLYYELGGPAEVNIGMDGMAVALCCRCFPLSQLEPVLSPHCWDRKRLRRHWPLAAFALDQYVFERSKLHTPQDDPGTSDLDRVLIEFYRVTVALNRKYSRLQFPYLRIFDRLLKPLGQLQRAPATAREQRQAAGEQSRSDRLRLQTAAELRKVLKRMVALKAAAAEAIRMVDASLLDRPGSQVANPALAKLVWRSALIWRSLTGLQPATLAASGTVARPAFARFVQALAALGDGSSPSAQQITAALRARQREVRRQRPH